MGKLRADAWCRQRGSSVALAASVGLRTRVLVASHAGAMVAVVSGEAAAWMPAVVLDGIFAAASCAGFTLARQRVATAVLNRRAIEMVTRKGVAAR